MSEELKLIATDITVEDFIDNINMAIKSGALNEDILVVFIKKLERVVKVIKEDNKEQFKNYESIFGNRLKGYPEGVNILGILCKYGTSQSWVNYNGVNDKALLEAKKIKLEIDEFITFLETMWKTNATESKNENSGKFGLQPNRFLTYQGKIPVLRFIKEEVTGNVPELQTKTGLKLIY